MSGVTSHAPGKEDDPESLELASEMPPSLDCSACNLVTTEFTCEPSQIRAACLERGQAYHTSPVVISKPSWVPLPFVEHLLRNKRDSAIAEKFVAGSDITNMEGMLHTFVTAFTCIHMFGDYAFRGRHGVLPFARDRQNLRARPYLLSTQIHVDFEDEQVAFAAMRLDDGLYAGQVLGQDSRIPTCEDKVDADARAKWDDRLRRYMVYHLMPEQSLPVLSPNEPPWTIEQAAKAIRQSLVGPANTNLFRNRALLINGHAISLAMLHSTYYHALRNELSTLEKLIRDPAGYVFTYDPPAIFARLVSAELLNLVFVHALGELAKGIPLHQMRVFAFNDYADPTLLPLVRQALASQPSIQVMSRSQLFPPSNGGYLDTSIKAVADGATVVIHNNSDAFGQNIETEECTSLDGAIGVYSDAAAQLRRDRPDLFAHVI